MRYKFHELFRKEKDGRLTALRTMRIGRYSVGLGSTFGRTITVGGIDLFEFLDCDIEAEEEFGEEFEMIKIVGFYKGEDLKQVDDKVQKALEVALKYGSTDGGHHKMWVIDQMVRALTGDKYEEWVKKAKSGEDGPETYDWDEGSPP